MAIVFLLIAALVLMATMLFLTIGVNELEKKSLELAGLIRKRYTLAPQKAKNKTPGGPAQNNSTGKP
jgi:hypothetical protein